MSMRRYRNGSHQVRGNARRPFRHARRIQKIANSAAIHYSLLPIPYSDDTATVYYNYRHYEPVMGRWLQRDPIEEAGGVGLYILVSNFQATDCLGLTWDIVRAGRDHATAKTTELSDTFEDLAHEVKLNFDEYKTWANTEDETPVLCKEYEVPNLISVYVSKPRLGDGYITYVHKLRKKAESEANAFQGQKFKVVLYWLVEDAEKFTSMWEQDGIYGAIFAGHGSIYGYNADNSDSAINPSEISLQYKLAIVHAYSCYSADALITGNVTADGALETDTWKNKVSNEGEFIGYSGWANWLDEL